MKIRLLSTIGLGLMAIAAKPALALTVGEPKVLSTVGEPLHVFLPIKAQSWEWRALWVSVQSFQRGIGLQAVLYRPSGEKTDGYLELKSELPINELTVDLLATFETTYRATTFKTSILLDSQVDASVQQQLVAIVQQNNTNVGSNTPVIAPAPISAPRTDTGYTPVYPPKMNTAAVPTPNTLQPAKNTPVRDYLAKPGQPIKEIASKAYEPPSEMKASTYTTPSDYPKTSLRASEGDAPPDEVTLNGPADGYLVKKGESLKSIANKTKPSKMTTQKAMQMIFDANPHAFKTKSTSSLKAGVTLALPFNDTITSTSPSSNNDAIRKKVLELQQQVDRLQKSLDASK